MQKGSSVTEELVNATLNQLLNICILVDLVKETGEGFFEDVWWRIVKQAEALCIRIHIA